MLLKRQSPSIRRPKFLIFIRRVFFPLDYKLLFEMDPSHILYLGPSTVVLFKRFVALKLYIIWPISRSIFGLTMDFFAKTYHLRFFSYHANY